MPASSGPSRRFITALAVPAALAAGAGVLAGCSSPVAGEAPGASGSAAPTRSPRGERVPLRLAVFGDSITVGAVGWYLTAAPSSSSWVPYLGPECLAEHVVAKSGATTEDLGRMLPPADSPDVAVFAFGTNDLHFGRTAAQLGADVEGFAHRHATLGAGVQLALTSVGPRAGVPAERLTAWNQQVAALAAARGWWFLDAWPALRGADAAAWASPELTWDGLHPTELGARLLGSGYDRALAWAVAKRAAVPE